MNVFINNTGYFEVLEALEIPIDESIGMGTTNTSVSSKWKKLLEITTNEEFEKIKDIVVSGFYFDDEVLAFTSYDDNDPNIVVVVARDDFDFSKFKLSYEYEDGDE
jgi:hypothetical protein